MDQNIALPDGAVVFAEAFCAGLKPDPELWVDEWSEENMFIPADTGARHPGPYRLDTTPFARDVMRALSPGSGYKRVVAKVASQLWKTQVGINWIAASICRAPANILALEPTLGLTRRLASRIDKTIAAVSELRTKVAAPRSRDAKNTSDTKEFKGGALYINTAGSESNLAELTARYIYGDEIDRWERKLGQEGDPVKLSENRGMQFGRAAKFYFSSSPSEKGASKIDELFEMGDQRHCYVPCPHCGHMQELVDVQIRVNEAETEAHYLCLECDCLIHEHYKPQMFAAYEWRAHSTGDGETISFTQSALYAPLGAVTWLDLWREKRAAEEALEKGDDSLMRVYCNTRLGVVFDSSKQMTSAEELLARAEPYSLRAIPDQVLVLTAAVDTQDDRLELRIVGWGVEMERWTIDVDVIMGDPALPAIWNTLDEKLQQKFRHPCGKDLSIRAALVDSGGHHTHEVYHFCRRRQHRHILAIAGARKPGKPVIAQRPTKVDVTWQGVTEEGGATLWTVGTDTAKDWIYNRFKLTSGPGAQHFSMDLSIDFYKQLTAERKVTKFVKGFKRTDWILPSGIRNEQLDLEVYNLAAAHYLGMHKWNEQDWQKLKDYLAVTAAEDGVEVEAPEQPKPQPLAPRPARRTAQSSYLRK